MSGSSFDYLYRRDIGGALDSWAFDEAVKQLGEHDHPGAQAAATLMRELKQEAEAKWARLADLLHDLEWWRSNDYGEDQFIEACEKFLKENVAGEDRL